MSAEFATQLPASQNALIQVRAGSLELSNETVRNGSVTEELERMLNRAKSNVRARVEHVLGVVKRLPD